MLRLSLCSLMFWYMIAIGSVGAQDQSEQELYQKIQDYMRTAHSNGFCGAVLVARSGKIILSRGYGLANREQVVPNTNQTAYLIGSLTKQFTAAAILKLQMMGKLNVQDRIGKYFKKVPRNKRNITIHQLLTHSSGFPEAIGDDFEPISRDEFIRKAMASKLRFKPGEKYEYSNVGYSLLAAIVEIVSQQPYEVFLNQQLFQPANMLRTGYRVPRWTVDDLAHGYQGAKDWGTILDKPGAADGPYWNLRGNGGILSTVSDLYQWHRALRDDRILSEDAKRLYYTPHVQEGPNADTFYGYGWVVATTPRNTKVVAHNGGNGIFSADFRRYLDEDVVIIVCSNIAQHKAWQIAEQIGRILFGGPMDSPKKANHQSPNQ